MRRLLALLLACLLLGGCGGDDEETASTPTPTPEAPATPEDTGGEQGTGCEQVARPEPRDRRLRKPKRRLDPGKTYVATVATNCGDFEITLAVKQQPKTAASFKHMADEKFFDGLSFHRIAPGFVIQGGDPKGDSTGSAGYSIVETPPKDLVYTKGMVAMAKAESEPPGTSSSQFFIVTGEELPLPPDYALVGQVTGGEDTVDKIAVNGNDAEQPIDPVVMSSVTVTAK